MEARPQLGLLNFPQGVTLTSVRADRLMLGDVFPAETTSNGFTFEAQEVWCIEMSGNQVLVNRGIISVGKSALVHVIRSGS